MLVALPYLFVVAAGVAGIILSSYLHAKKSAPKPLVCPLGSDCSQVIDSVFSKFLGLPVELIGLLYYAFITLTYATFIVAPTLSQTALIFVAFAVSLLAFLFSVYLTFIQAFTIRQWCTWCLTSAALTSIIFLSALITIDYRLISFMAQFKPILIGGHLLGLALGLGAASMADIFFFRFLRDFRISRLEAETLNTISQIVWLGLGILIFTGIGLFMIDPLNLLASSKFLLKMVVVSVIAVNGAFLNLYIAPLLTRITFGRKHHHEAGELHKERKIAFALGSVSFISWYSAFALGLIPSIPLSFPTLLAIYLGILLVGITGSQIVERIIYNRHKPTSPKLSPHDLEE